MCSFKLIYFVIFVLNIYNINAQISDKRLCVDQECKEPASLAKTLLRYTRSGPGMLSFPPNEKVTVYSKEAGSNLNLWGVEIRGQRGYIPKEYVREYKVLKKPKLLVDTEPTQKSQVPPNKKDSVDPDKVQEQYEVVDGTTIYLTPRESINPSGTAGPVVPTAVPPKSNEVDHATEALNSEDGLKEDATKKTVKESLVGNVLSTFSHWMEKDSTSEEKNQTETNESDEEDDEDEDDEGDEEEDEDEDEDLEVDADGASENSAAINFVHNLPSGVSVGPYNLDLGDKSDNTNAKVLPAEQKEKAEVVTQSKPTTEEHLFKKVTSNVASIDNNVVQSTGNTQELPISVEKKDKDISEAPKNLFVSNEAPPSHDYKSKDSEYNSLFSVGQNSLLTSNIGTHSVDSKAQTEDKTFETIITETKQNPLDLVETQSGILDEVTKSINTQKDTKSVDPRSEAEDKATETINRGSSKNSLTQLEDTNGRINNLEKQATVTEPTVGEDDQAPVVDEVTPNPIEPEMAELVAEQNQTQQFIKNEVMEVKSQELEPGPSVALQYSQEQIQSNLPSDQTVSKIESLTSSNSNDESNRDTETVGGTFQSSAPSDLPNLPQTTATVIETNSEQTRQEESDLEVVANEINDTLVTNTEKGLKFNKDLTVNTSDEKLEESLENNTSKEEGGSAEDVNDEPQIQNSALNLEDGNAEITQENAEGMESGGLFSSILSLFDSGSEESKPLTSLSEPSIVTEDYQSSQSKESVIGHCDASSEICNDSEKKNIVTQKGVLDDIELSFNSDIFLYLLTTSISVIIFLFGYMVLDRSRREAPLVARINKLEKELLVTLKENEVLQEKGPGSVVEEVDGANTAVVEQLTQKLAETQLVNQNLELQIEELRVQLESKEALEEQIESLEKELETSTEVGMELNRIISEMLDPTNGSDRLKENVEQLQRQLLEQKDTINTISMSLKEKEAENITLQEDLGRTKKKSTELQGKLEEMVDKVLQIEKEKDQQQATLQNEITVYHQKYSEAVSKVDLLNNEIQILRVQLTEVQRQADIRSKENRMLQDGIEKIKSLKNDKDALRSLLDSTSIKAELQQLKVENDNYTQQLQHETSLKAAYEKKYQALNEEVNLLHQKYEIADKEKVEANSRLEVLNNYFKKREAELQEEVIKYKSIWEVKEGEATSTTERIKYMQEEIENYKAQNETLKQEIISQEIDLKSQISMLEKKVHENWVTARQTERKLEDAKQEAAQLRNRLTLRERAINEERAQNRLQSPLEQNGDLPLSPHPIDSPASPPLLYGGRDHITKSPPIPGLPPFLPPPPGAPFIPPPLHGMPPFMPPPPSMFPGDHRPPPLGRMSSPPLNSRYSPDVSAFSPYDRNSPSPPYDSEYGASPPPMRGYSPYNSRDDRRDYKRPPHVRTNGRNMKGSVVSSGSEHSNDSLDKINRKQSKMV